MVGHEFFASSLKLAIGRRASNLTLQAVICPGNLSHEGLIQSKLMIVDGFIPPISHVLMSIKRKLRGLLITFFPGDLTPKNCSGFYVS